MLMNKNFYFAFIFLSILTSCTPKIYKNPDFYSKVSDHKIVAILPSEVNLSFRPNELKKLTAEDIIVKEEQTGYDIQDKMFMWLLRRSDKLKYTVSFQDIKKTNSLLKAGNISYKNIYGTSAEELCKLLGVDAVISSKAIMKKPMSEGAALAVGIVFGAWGTTNEVNTSISINEAKNGELLWKYDYLASGSVATSTTGLVDALMRNASKRFPYVTPKEK